MRALLVCLALATAAVGQQLRVAADGSLARGRFAVRDGVCSDLTGQAPDLALAAVERVVFVDRTSTRVDLPVVTLVDGDRLVLDDLELTGDELRGRHALLGEVVLDAQRVHAIELATPDRDQPAWPAAPCLVLTRGESVPVICAGLDATEVVGQHALLGALHWKRARVLTIVLRPQESSSTDPGVVALTTSGERLSGQLRAVDAQDLSLAVAWRPGLVRVPLGELWEWSVRGGAVRHVAARRLSGDELRQAPPFGQVTALGRQVGFDGAPLRLGPRPVGSGFAVPASTTVRLRVEPGEQWFRCSVGLAPGQPPGVTGRFLVFAAGSTVSLFDSGELSVDAAPLSTGNLFVGDAELLELQLHADPVHAFVMGVWADPVFARSSP